MASNLLTAGGCVDDNRIAQDGAGAGSRNWLHAVGDANVDVDNTKLYIVSFTFEADDMNDASAEDHDLMWRNVTDAGSFADLASTGEIKWISGTDLVNSATVVSAEDSGANSQNCTTKGWPRRDGIEREGANTINRGFTQDFYEDFQWAFSMADSIADKQYEFQVVSADNSVMKVGATKFTGKDPLSLIAESRDDDDNLVVSCGANLLERTGSFPYTYTQIDSATTHATTGDHTFQFLSTNTMRIFYLKELAPDQWDMSDEVTGA